MPLILVTIFCLLLSACGPPSDPLKNKIKELVINIKEEPDNPALYYELGKAYIEKYTLNNLHTFMFFE